MAHVSQDQKNTSKTNLSHQPKKEKDNHACTIFQVLDGTGFYLPPVDGQNPALPQMYETLRVTNTHILDTW